MRKFITVAIPIVAIALFICIMLSGGFLKKPIGKEKGIPQAIENVIQDVNNEDWEEASKSTDDLDKTWKKVIFRIQFSSERDEMNYLSTNIARLQGAILAKDKASALLELYEANDHWEGLGK